MTPVYAQSGHHCPAFLTFLTTEPAEPFFFGDVLAEPFFFGDVLAAPFFFGAFLSEPFFGIFFTVFVEAFALEAFPPFT